MLLSRSNIALPSLLPLMLPLPCRSPALLFPQPHRAAVVPGKRGHRRVEHFQARGGRVPGPVTALHVLLLVGEWLWLLLQFYKYGFFSPGWVVATV